MSAMEPFTLSLPDGRQTTGLLSLPSRPAHPPKGTPLVVTVHGGTYTASYYDADAAHSIRNISIALKVPVVAITRPGYGDSTALPPLQEGETWNQVNGRYLHDFILPAIWKEYGAKSGASSIVLHAHSIGSAIAIVTTALHNRSPKTAVYPLCGLVTSGIGLSWADEASDDSTASKPENEVLDAIDSFKMEPGVESPSSTWPVEVKDQLMLCPQDDLCSPDLLKGSTAKINHAMSIIEPFDIRQQWPHYWKEYARDICVPHMYGLGEYDGLWKSGQKLVDEYAKVFSGCVKMEASSLPCTPHSIELSYMGQAWLARSLGFAMECAVWDALGRGKR